MHILCSVNFPKILPFMRSCRKIWRRQMGRRWKYGGALPAGLVRLHARKTLPRQCTPPPRPHTHTHSKYVILIAFPRQQCFRERTSVLRYTYIASLVQSIIKTEVVTRPPVLPKTITRHTYTGIDLFLHVFL
jgi:hypothetical protein